MRKPVAVAPGLVVLVIGIHRGYPFERRLEIGDRARFVFNRRERGRRAHDENMSHAFLDTGGFARVSNLGSDVEDVGEAARRDGKLHPGIIERCARPNKGRSKSRQSRKSRRFLRTLRYAFLFLRAEPGLCFTPATRQARICFTTCAGSTPVSLASRP